MDIKEVKRMKKENKKSSLIKEKKREIKGYEIIFFAFSFIVLVTLIVMVNKNNTKAHCKKAVCNEDNTICYNYKVDKNGKTVKTWQGSCAKK